MGSIWGIRELVPHPDNPPDGVQKVTSQLLGFDVESLFVEFAFTPRSEVSLPAESAPGRTDGLWRTTCFEVFIKPVGSEQYLELNFSPSFAWAAYAFDRYRDGMRPLPMRLDPEITIFETDETHYWLSAEFDVTPFLSGSTMLGLSAVVEHQDGSKSYWALAHPPGPPDFHHPDCFTLELPPPGPACNLV